ncbi:hypothetical protein [Paenibacillus sp. CF384]|uniref:hypothetical protein n=1 Tax=Paenibacillus sp. CF384 TaxID=1884382 RepID=UPI0008947CF4|nr:hypothetical protein [Paenibacillus sp. CF384]SDW80862.1 hypothetical protein SAMN05518855_1005191 [Paenibacillus sp. CF384]
MVGAIVLWLIMVSVFFFILHAVIQSALDSSNMAKNIQDIRDFLYDAKKEGKASKHNAALRHRSIQSQAPEDLYEECPACGEKVIQHEPECPSCGLRLKD